MTGFSGKFVLRVSTDLHQRLVKQAREKGVSLNRLCTDLLEREPQPNWLARVRSVYGKRGLIGIVLFGSRARGRARESSDTDLLLVFREGVSITRDFYREWDDLPSGENVPADLSIHCVSLPDDGGETPGSLWLEVAMEGIVLWAASDRVENRLRQIRRKIASGAFVRDSSHGHGFWRKIG